MTHRGIPYRETRKNSEDRLTEGHKAKVKVNKSKTSEVQRQTTNADESPSYKEPNRAELIKGRTQGPENSTQVTQLSQS